MEKGIWAERPTISALIVVIVVVIIYLVVDYLMTNKAKRYLKDHAQTLSKNNVGLLTELRTLESRLIPGQSEYHNDVGALKLNYIYDCSSQIVARAKTEPVKYLMKYANFAYDMACLAKVDFCIGYMNDLLRFREKYTALDTQLKAQIPIWVKWFTRKISLPAFVCNLDGNLLAIQLPVFRFKYVSPKGQSTNNCLITVEPSLLQQIKTEMMGKLTKEQHKKQQRTLMTADLRNAIKARDNYTCQICGNSVMREPNLLLEVDHIIPVARGGETKAENLQTLCWKCNRAKSDNIQ